MKEKLAIVGTGIAGLGCAHFLHKDFELELFDTADYIGGHSNTVEVEEEGRKIAMDTGFIVYNEITYPHLTRLFAQIEAPVKNSSMSFSVQHIPDGLEFCGSGINGLFAQRKNLLKPRFWRLLRQINRFNTNAPEILNNNEYAGATLGEYIEKENYSQDLLDYFLIPMSSAVWSTPKELMLNFPIITLVQFFYNHGFLGLNTQHQWKTVDGGSREYVKKIIQPFQDKFHLGNGVKQLKRNSDGVELILQNDQKRKFDKVILATHADTSLGFLAQPLPLEKELLSTFRYEKNLATLHIDDAVMPDTRSAWSSWNYRVNPVNTRWNSSVVYWMNSLQNVSRKQNYFVSINDEGVVNPDKILQTIPYEHPVFTLETRKAAERLDELNESGPVYFCGSYFRYGFHEDAFLSAVNLSNKILDRDVWT